MTEKEILLVQQSWQRLSDNIEEVGETFYLSLFKAEPQFEALFRSTDPRSQGKKFAEAMTLLVAKLHLAEPDGQLVSLSKRHTAYQVKPGYFDVFGEVLLSTLQNYFGEDWDQDTQAAWGKAFEKISGLMQENLA